MASTWNSMSTLQPPAYSSTFNEKLSHEGLTFVDFFPDYEKPAGFIMRAQYKDFRSVVGRANDWLRANPQWEIKTCESVTFKDNEKPIDSEKMSYTEYGGAPILYIRGLRLWMNSRKNDGEKCQQIGFLNLVPQEVKPGGLFSVPVFETLDDIINKFNQMNRYQPIPGRIITIESQEMKIGSGDGDPDKSNWMESRIHSNQFLCFLRVYYVITEANSEEIGIKDFVPSVIESGSIFTLPKYEMFPYVVNKTSEWCSQQPDIRIYNIQTVEAKVIKGQENLLNTQIMSYKQHADVSTYYVRVLRVAYMKPMTYSNLYPTLSSPITRLTCKTFVPVKVSSGLFMPDFETLQQTKARVFAWIKATGAQVINAQTSCVKFKASGIESSAETTLTDTERQKNEYFVYVIRIYLKGFYPEPPEGTLPPIPELKKSNCLIS